MQYLVYTHFKIYKRCESFLKIYGPNQLIKGLDDISEHCNEGKGLFDKNKKV